jgi:hypothetical protein
MHRFDFVEAVRRQEHDLNRVLGQP